MTTNITLSNKRESIFFLRTHWMIIDCISLRANDSDKVTDVWVPRMWPKILDTIREDVDVTFRVRI